MAVGTELGDLHICDSTELKATVHGFCAGEAITALAQHIKVSNRWNLYIDINWIEHSS